MRESSARYAKHSETSRDGASHANRTLSLRQRAVLNVIISKRGASIAEIAKELGVPNNEVSGRIAELRDDKRLIVDSGEKRATVTACRSIVWTLHESVRFLYRSYESERDQPDLFHSSETAPAASVAPNESRGRF